MRLNEILSLNSKELHDYLFFEADVSETKENVLMAVLISLTRKNMALEREINEINNRLDQDSHA